MEKTYKQSGCIIDAHCHIYPEKIAAKAVAGTDRFYGTGAAGLGTVSDLMEMGEQAGISHFIVQSVATTAKQVRSINEFIAASVEGDPRLTGLGTMHPDIADPEAEIDHLQALGLLGIKIHPDIQGVDIDDPKMQNALNLINAAGKSLSYENQLAILEKFRGDEGALDFLKGIYEQHGYWHAKTAEEMGKSIPQQAINDMRERLAFEDHDKSTDNTQRNWWTRGRFEDYLIRMGWNDDGVDAMRQQLVEMKRDNPNQQENAILARGIAEFDNLQDGTMGARAAVYDRTMRALENARSTEAAAADQKERDAIQLESRYVKALDKASGTTTLDDSTPSAEEQYEALIPTPALDRETARFNEISGEAAENYLRNMRDGKV